MGRDEGVEARDHRRNVGEVSSIVEARIEVGEAQ